MKTKQLRERLAAKSRTFLIGKSVEDFLKEGTFELSPNYQEKLGLERSRDKGL